MLRPIQLFLVQRTFDVAGAETEKRYSFLLQQARGCRCFFSARPAPIDGRIQVTRLKDRLEARAVLILANFKELQTIY